jgi:hypothetical protein
MYNNTHKESLIEARHGRIEAFCSLTGVIGLTGLNQQIAAGR